MVLIEKVLSEIRKRIILLKEAKLIMNVGLNKVGLTSRGKRFLERIRVQNKEMIAAPAVEISNSIVENHFGDGIEEILKELRLSGRDSRNPDRLEKAVCEAFRELGFKSEWLGGSGRTDVLLQAQSAPKLSYRVIVDAKSTLSGEVTEGLIDFDTLKEHKKLYAADYTVIVGYSFRGERLEKRAKEHNVTLIDIENFEELIKKHKSVPISISLYRKVFEQAGFVDLSVLDDDRNKIKRFGLLVTAVMQCLAEESLDPFTQGIVSTREIYRSIRDDNRFDIAPDIKEIEAILELMSSLLIECVGKNNQGYYSLGTLEEAKRKFEFFAKACIGKIEL